jgi:uncharacterized membrane protein
MNGVTFFWTTFLAFLPISELRGAIPFAVAHGWPWLWAFLYGAFINALVAPACWIFLGTFHKLFLHLRWYADFFNRFVERARSKVHEGVERWGWWGIGVFVAIPLPLTGAWTGTLGAWVLGLDKKKTMVAVILGVLVSGIIVTSVTVLGIRAFDIFIKRV